MLRFVWFSIVDFLFKIFAVSFYTVNRLKPLFGHIKSEHRIAIVLCDIQFQCYVTLDRTKNDRTGTNIKEQAMPTKKKQTAKESGIKMRIRV